MTRRAIVSFTFLCLALSLAACHSSRIDVTVENRSGNSVQLLEVNYPSASFGTDRLADGADLHYPIQVRGSGAVRIQYTDAAGTQIRSFGSYLKEHQSGRLTIVLRQGGAVDFQPDVSAGH
jgi:hypothetical protein